MWTLVPHCSSHGHVNQLRPGAPPASLCVRLEVTQLEDVVHSSLIWTCTPNVSSRFDFLEIRALLVADVGQLDDNLKINLVFPHRCNVHLWSCLFCHSLPGSHPHSTSHGPLTSSPAFTFWALARNVLLGPLVFWPLVPNCTCYGTSFAYPLIFDLMPALFSRGTCAATAVTATIT